MALENQNLVDSSKDNGAGTRLSIRSYTFASHTHAHDHHQLVLPLVGGVNIHTGRHEGRAVPGQCIITLAGDEHRFEPEDGSRFLVADMDELPENLSALDESFVRISAPVQAFCFFAQTQLEDTVNASLEQSMGECFFKLIGEETFLPAADPRIERVANHLKNNPRLNPTLPQLAELACLSLSQLKSLFKKQLGQTPGQYLLACRMEKARALLVHTDYPVNVIASRVGYQDPSAFSHRFSVYFGYSPRKLRTS